MQPQQQLSHQRRVLALDPGSRRTGVALSDELGMFAHPRPAIHRDSMPQMVDEVVRLVGADDIGEVVVGLHFRFPAAIRARQQVCANSCGHCANG